MADALAAHDAAEHHRVVREWGRQVWQAWALHHPAIRAWHNYALTPPF